MVSQEVSSGNRALLIDSRESHAQSLSSILGFIEWGTLEWVESLEEAKHVLEEDSFSLLFLGENSATERGHSYELLRKMDGTIPILFLLDEDVEATLPGSLSDGMLGHLSVPIKQTQLITHLEQSAAYNKRRKSRAARKDVSGMFGEMIGHSAPMNKVRQLMAQVADSDANVLILGESGTGKEVVAQCLHRYSARKGNAFVPINCGAIPADLLESELFGHEKGAFTGAVSARIGRFELANQGTLFLDEISEMPLFMQVKLLRVLQEQVLERLGSTKSVNINVRIIAATNKDLDSLVEDGTFREDLFYRLNVVPLNIVPLRERLEDLPLLIEHFQNQIEDYDGGKVKFTDSAYDAMVNYSWPGNVRELYNIVERVTVLYPKQDITIAEIPQKIKMGGGIAKTSTLSQKIITNPYELGDNFSLKDKICEIESTYIKKALAENNGVVAQAANALGIRRTTLVEKLKKLNIEPKSLREAR